MRRILLGAAMAAMLAGAGLEPALAQGNPFQPLVYVNDSAVTRYELDQRVPGGSTSSTVTGLDERPAKRAQASGICSSPRSLQSSCGIS